MDEYIDNNKKPQSEKDKKNELIKKLKILGKELKPQIQAEMKPLLDEEEKVDNESENVNQ